MPSALSGLSRCVMARYFPKRINLHFHQISPFIAPYRCLQHQTLVPIYPTKPVRAAPDQNIGIGAQRPQSGLRPKISPKEKDYINGQSHRD